MIGRSYTSAAEEFREITHKFHRPKVIEILEKARKAAQEGKGYIKVEAELGEVVIQLLKKEGLGLSNGGENLWYINW